MVKSPLVSVVICNWNGGEVYRRCLTSVAKINYPNWELVVVDDASTDGSNLYSLPHGAKLIANKVNVNFAVANNIGFRATRGEYLLLLNNDTIVPPNLLKVLVEKIQQDKTIGVIQPKIKMLDNPEFLDNAGSFLTRIGFLQHWGFGKRDSAEFDHEREIFSAKGACMFMRREVVNRVGLFDPDYISYFEESDFCWRVWLSGYRVIYYPVTSILHKVGFSTKRINVANINYHNYKNRICTLIKNLGFGNLFLVLPLHLIVSLGISLAFLVKCQFRNSLIIWRAIFWNLRNFKQTSKKRSQVQGKRVVSDKIIFRKVSVPINWKAFFGDFTRIQNDLKVKTAS